MGTIAHIMKSLIKLVLLLILIALAGAAGWLVGRTGMGAAVPVAELSELERQFTERMQDVALVGRFTVSGREDRQASPDRYDIISVTKVGDDQWRWNARMRYGSVDATLPIVVTMKWVGDTPMITLTDLSIPGIGTYTARVFFYGDRYAGTWQGSRVGGHMFGAIQKGAEVAK